ncbi:hypothetical protein B0H14DRAFT_3446548 [Mycena olivaceomarginata]|nr:hypothetical protein B0H14DRAFT_3446548 [Mycena olivaceomarginata]
MKRGRSLLQTIKVAVAPKADVSTAALRDTVIYDAGSGLDAGGAKSVELAGPFHSGGYGMDTFERLTGVVRDKNGNWIYFYRKSDHTF